jgi:hypothetical protein
MPISNLFDPLLLETLRDKEEQIIGQRLRDKT